MSARDTVSEELILEAMRDEAARGAPSGVLLIGMQACSTVSAVNLLVGSERVVLLHLDRSAGGVGCGLGNRELFLGSQDSLRSRDGGGEPFAIVGLNVEAAKSYRLLREIVQETAGYVDRAGLVLAAGPKKGGAEVAARALRDVFESVSLVAYRKGQRIFRASRPRPRADTDHEPRHEEIATLSLRGRELRLIQDERIFAKGRLDAATRMLAEVFEVPPGAAVLDLGCGSGVLGILAALIEPSSHGVLVDSDPLAVDVSRRNAALNGASNATVYLSDVLRDVPRELPGPTFDVVLINPPFHRGRSHDVSIAERFLTEASQALRPGGRLYVVCNRFLRYEPTLERLVGPVQEVAGDGHFKVLLAERQADGRRGRPRHEARGPAAAQR